MEKKALSIVDDIADAFIDAIEKGDYVPKIPIKLQIARSLEELNLNLRTLIKILQNTTNNASDIDSENMDQALRKDGEKAIRDISLRAVREAIERKNLTLGGEV